MCSNYEYVCVFRLLSTKPRGGPCHGPQRAAFSGLWAIPSTESGPQPLLEEEEEEEEELFVFNDTIEGPRAPAVKPGRVTQA